MSPALRIKFSSLMFLQYFMMGIWWVPLGSYAGLTLGFSGTQIALLYGTNAVSAMLTPMLVGALTDRYFSAQRVLAFLFVISGGALIMASYQTSFIGVFSCLFLAGLCFMPTIGISNLVVMNRLQHPRQEFPGIRVLGTIGWIIAGLIIGYFRLELTFYPMRLGGGIAIIGGLLCLLLPDTPPFKSGPLRWSRMWGGDAWVLFKNKSVVIFSLCVIVVHVPIQFYYSFGNLFFSSIGMEGAAAKMSLGQVSEMIIVLLLPWFFLRLGLKWVMAVGIALWSLRFLFFIYGDLQSNLWMFYVGILAHGMCFAFVILAGQIYIDQIAPREIRASAQSLVTLMTSGLGLFLGSIISGPVVNHYTLSPGVYNWDKIWLVPVFAAAIAFVPFVLFFKEEKLVKGP